MKMLFYLFGLQCMFTVALAQETELLNRSSFRHDYLVTDLQYIEELADTAKAQFIANVIISGSHQDLLIEQWFTVLKAKAKEQGANLYFIEKYTEDETHSTVVAKLFFAGTYFMKTNKTKINKNNIYVFNEGRSKNDTAGFYLNQKKITFDPKKYYTIAAKPYQLYNITLTARRSAKHNHSFPRSAPSVFYILPTYKKSVITNGAINTQGSINLNFIKNKPVECNYDLGRFLLEIYK